MPSIFRSWCLESKAASVAQPQRCLVRITIEVADRKRDFHAACGSVAANIIRGSSMWTRIDGRNLATLMIDFDVGVAVSASYVVKRIDSDYFEEG